PPQHPGRARARPAEVALMDLSFTPLQDELRGQARGFLEANAEPRWSQLAELGWTGAAVPDDHGGAGLTFLEEGVLHEEAGRALLHAPLWSTSTPRCTSPLSEATRSGSSTAPSARSSRRVTRAGRSASSPAARRGERSAAPTCCRHCGRARSRSSHSRRWGWPPARSS